MNYPTLENEIQLLTDFQERGGVNDISKINAVLSATDIKAYQKVVREIFIEPKLIEFIAKLTAKTRYNADLYVGASPRASLALLTASKALAAIRGRSFVTPDDITFVAKPVMRHRIILTPEKEMEGVTPNDIIDELMKTVEVPR